MANAKATRTSDVTGIDESAQPPTFEDRVAAYEDVTDPGMVAKVDEVRTVKVKSPWGYVTEVPESISQTLLDSGYSKTK